MKTKVTFLFFIALYSISVSPINASHLAGGEITYRWLGGNTYHIVFTLYRDCRGIAAPSTLPVNLVSSCGDSFSATAFPVPGTGTDINPACPSTITTCHGG